MRALILIVLLVVVAFVFASEHPLNKILKSSKDALAAVASRKPRSRKPRSAKPVKSQKPRSRKPLKARIANLQKKLVVLKKKLAAKKAAKSQKPRSRKPKSAKSAKPAKSQKPRSRKPKSQKPKSAKPVKTLSDAAFWKKLSNWWKTKGKKIFSEENIDKAKKIYDILKTKKSQPTEEAPQADSEQTVSCGQAYQSGQALGEKQCVMVQGKPVVVETAQAFYKMEAAAKAAGVTLKINSGFRKMSEQQYLYNCYLSKKCNNGNLAARPGYSNHQNGKALDIAVANPTVFNWMKNNASKFGFVRTVPSENWHWELRNTKCNAFVSYTCQ